MKVRGDNGLTLSCYFNYREPYVELMAGTCACGGQFRLTAKGRCPQCRSLKHRDDPDNPWTVDYD